MTKFQSKDDWPDVADDMELSFHEELARTSKPLRTWVRASPCRALSADGLTLYVARTHGLDRRDESLDVYSLPPDDEGDPGIFAIDVFHADAAGNEEEQSQPLATDLEVRRITCEPGCLRVALQLTEAQRVALEVPDAAIDLVLPTSPNGTLANELYPVSRTNDGHLLLLAELLALGGGPSGALAAQAAAQRQELANQELRRAAAQRAMHERMDALLAKHWWTAELGFPLTVMFDKQVDKAGLGAHLEALRRLARPCWTLTPSTAKRGCRVGGLPDLPPGTAWPMWEGEPMHFIAQIDLAELPALPELPLPREGLISLFTGMIEPADDVEHLVLYTPAGTATAPAHPPNRNYRDEQLEITGSVSLVAAPAIALPSYGSETYNHSVAGGLDSDDTHRYFALQKAVSDRDDELHVLGHPDVAGIQPEAAAYFRRARRPDSRYRFREELETDEQRANFDYIQDHLDEITAGMLDWVPLLRIPSYMDLGLVFWDAGVLNVMIRRADLAALRFDQTAAIIATG